VARINIVVPGLSRMRFSGGLLCIFQYANGLVSRGHDVSIVPVGPSEDPVWFGKPYGELCKEPRGDGLNAKLSSKSTVLKALFWDAIGGRPKQYKAAWRRALADAALHRPHQLPTELQLGAKLLSVRQRVAHADVTVATSFETALPVAMFGTGHCCYFAQHYEPYFCGEYRDPQFAEREASLSYKLGLHLIANSAWLKQMLLQASGSHVDLCVNAVDHEIYNGMPSGRPLEEEVKVISYGGRNARWKGFSEMAEAIRATRKVASDRNIRWQVFGDALLPPDNSVAWYEPLGFLQPSDLARAYRQADILLSASWYESFPLFPIEAMACGIPVITTQTGTEDYAEHGRTAEVVEARNIESIVAGLLHLIRDDAYRCGIARTGHEVSKNFTWEHSVSKFEALLLGSADGRQR
jgi:glycosyltransferase involved in cell wall biosynthesis